MALIKKIIYLDTAAATPLAAPVARLLTNLSGKIFGNAGSLHRAGLSAAKLLTAARKTVADFLDAHPDEIIFTSGGTEANNLALFGVASALLKNKIIKQPGHIITSAIEHLSVLEPLRELERQGWRVTVLPVSETGIVDPAELQAALKPETALVSIMLANNELGTIQPLRDIAKLLRAHRERTGTVLPYFHTDACQVTRFIPLRVAAFGVDLLTINSAKVYGPKGVGALFVRRGVPISPIIFGGGQEANRRSGTENVPLLAAFAGALDLATTQRSKEVKQLTSLRDYFINSLAKKLPAAVLNGTGEKLPDIINFSLPHLLGEQVVIELDALGIAASTGSACSAQDRDLSYVVEAITGSSERAAAAVRISLGRDTTKAQIDYLIKCLVRIKAKYDTTRKLLS